MCHHKKMMLLLFLLLCHHRLCQWTCVSVDDDDDIGVKLTYVCTYVQEKYTKYFYTCKFHLLESLVLPLLGGSLATDDDDDDDVANVAT